MRRELYKVKLNIKNNKGFSLAEMVVAFALLAFVAICVFGAVTAGGNMFTRVNEDVNLQYKSQTAMTQFQECFMPCSTAITKMEDGTVYFSDSEKVYALKYYEGVISYASCEISSAKADLPTKTMAPLCSDVSAFKVTVNTPSGNIAGSVKVELTVSSGGKSYSTSQIFSFRNEPVYIKDAGDGGYLNTLVDTITA